MRRFGGMTLACVLLLAPATRAGEPGDAAMGCALQPVQFAELEARSRSGDAVNATSRGVFAGE